eukprot:1346643-Rhodomonas_salina.1
MLRHCLLLSLAVSASAFSAPLLALRPGAAKFALGGACKPSAPVVSRRLFSAGASNVRCSAVAADQSQLAQLSSMTT